RSPLSAHRSRATASRTSWSGTSRDDQTAECRGDDRILATSSSSLELAVPADQRIRRAVMLKLWLGCGFQFRNNPLSKSFAEPHAPLMEGIDLPDRALGEHNVLIKRDQLA